MANKKKCKVRTKDTFWLISEMNCGKFIAHHGNDVEEHIEECKNG